MQTRVSATGAMRSTFLKVGIKIMPTIYTEWLRSVR